jgi:hypothetical protein
LLQEKHNIVFIRTLRRPRKHYINIYSYRACVRLNWRAMGRRKTRQVHSVTVSRRQTPSNTESVCSGDNFGAAQRGARRKTSEEVTRQPDPEMVVTRNTCQAGNQRADGELSAQPQVEAPTQLPTGPLVDMEALVQVLSRLVAPRPIEPPILPEFSGLEHEDPERFLEKCRERLAATHPESWRDRVATRLRGNAESWWSINRAILPTFPDLERGLIEKYGGLDKVVRLHAEFYGTRQAKEEPTETFLQKKKLLAARILPTMTEKVLVATCRTLLRDELVMYSAFASPQTLEELSRGAGTIERLLNQKKAVPPATTSTKSLPRCRYCPGTHFHADCPELRRNPGNGQGATTAAGPSRRTVGPVENQQ